MRPAGACGAGEERLRGAAALCAVPRIYKLVANSTRGCGAARCLFDVFADPTEATDLAAERPAVLRTLVAGLAEESRTAWADTDPRNKECWTVCNAQGHGANCWLEYARKHGRTMLPFSR